MGLWREIGPVGRLKGRHRARVAKAISAAALEGFEARPIGLLSGGRMQRTPFARLLLQDARLVLLDEPFTAIDVRTMADLLASSLVKHSVASQLARPTCFSPHLFRDRNLVERFFNRIKHCRHVATRYENGR